MSCLYVLNLPAGAGENTARATGPQQDDEANYSDCRKISRAGTEIWEDVLSFLSNRLLKFPAFFHPGRKQLFRRNFYNCSCIPFSSQAISGKISSQIDQGYRGNTHHNGLPIRMDPGKYPDFLNGHRTDKAQEIPISRSPKEGKDPATIR